MARGGSDAPRLHAVGGAAALIAASLLAGSAPTAPSAVLADPNGWRTVSSAAVAPRRTPDQALLDQLAAPGVTVIDAALGDVDGDGHDELVAVFVRPPRPTLLADRLTTPAPRDKEGRTLHLGVYDLEPAGADPTTTTLAQHWVAGTVLRPISSVAVCDSTLVLGYASAVGSADTVAVGVATWRGYGFTASAALPDLPGAGVPACGDQDGDGALEPLVLGRSLP